MSAKPTEALVACDGGLKGVVEIKYVQKGPVGSRKDGNGSCEICNG